MARPEVFESQQAPDPQPKPGEVVIRVKAIGVNFADLLQRMGVYPDTPKPPFVPGIEIAGVVEKVAEGGKAGDGEPLGQVTPSLALTNFNAYAEWAAVPARQVYRLPPGMSFEDAAAIPVNYVTALSRDVRDGQSASRRPNARSWRRRRSGNCRRAACAGARHRSVRHRRPCQAGVSAQNRRQPRD